MNRELLEALQGCLKRQTIHAAEQKLATLSQRPNFTQQILTLIPSVHHQHDLLALLLATLKNFFKGRYTKEVKQNQKRIFRQSALDLFYQIKHNQTAIQLYKEIINFVVTADFKKWPSLTEQILKDLSEGTQAGVYVCREVTKVYQYIEGEDRLVFEQFVFNVFPKLQEIVQKIFNYFNENTKPLLEQIFNAFFSTFHFALPLYLRNFINFEKWMSFFNFIFKVPTDSLTAKSQFTAARIYQRIFSKYCNNIQEVQKFKSWGLSFRSKYATKLYNEIYTLLVNKFGRRNEDIDRTLIYCIKNVVKQPYLRKMITNEQIQTLFYQGILLPLCASTKDELNIFQNDGIEYIRRQEDCQCYMVRKAILELIVDCTYVFLFNGKSELRRMFEYCKGIIKGGNDKEKQVVVRILTAIGKALRKKEDFKENLQGLVVTYFQPLLLSPNKLLNSLTLNLLSQYLPFGDLSKTIIISLMEQIYSKIIYSSSRDFQVVRYYAILAFTSLLEHQAALKQAKPHFSSILQIYVKTLNEFDHENLFNCLESIVKYFNKEVVNFAPDLLNHLLKLFPILAKNQQYEADSNNSATFALSIIKQIFNCNLPHILYFNFSSAMIQLFRGIYGQYSTYFNQILSLFAVFCYKARQMTDFQYPYVACRYMLEGNQFNFSGSRLSNSIIQQISKIVKRDEIFEDNIIAIVKNIIQKAPDHVLRMYSWPNHQQLILALIENKRILPNQLENLNTSKVNPLWSLYLSSYAYVVYNVGSLANPNYLQEIVGVSLYPWLKEGVCSKIVKIVTNSLDQQNDDDFLEENIAQTFAYQDQDDEEDYNKETTGTKYTYLYDSPFDVSKDREMLIAQIKSLSQETSTVLAQQLNQKYYQKIQLLMMTRQ